MPVESFCFFFGIIILGVGTALEDARSHRISNAWIAGALGYTAIVEVFLSLQGKQIPSFLVLPSLVNILVSAAAAVFFWQKKWWGGGDAKLFVCYAALIPLARYPVVYLNYYFASFFLLLVIFIPASLWVFFCAQRDQWLSPQSILPAPHLKGRQWEFVRLASGYVGIFFMSGLLPVIFSGLFPSIKAWPLLVWVGSLLAYKPIFRLLQRQLWAVWVLWALSLYMVFLIPRAHQGIILPALLRGVLFSAALLVVRLYFFRVIDVYIDRTKKEYMAFAGWMFAGALVVWFSRDVLSLKVLFLGH
ncbi:MAG: prepilin peptidase [Candidatus Omnitrophota bacterium]